MTLGRRTLAKLQMSLTFIFKVKRFEISLFCHNFKTVVPKAINLGMHMHVVKGTYVVKFKPDYHCSGSSL